MTIAHDEAGTFYWTRTVAELTLRLEASKLSPSDRTGLHAKIVILLEDTQLAFSRFNVERDEDRVRLVNSAYKHIENDLPLKKAYPKEYLKGDLDNFCSGLEAALMDTIEVEDLAGSLDATPPPFLLYPYILKGGSTILFGPPGRGKSWMLLLQAVSLDAGVRKLFYVEQARKVLVVNLERSAESMRLRLGGVNAALGLPRDRKVLFINARGKSLSDVADRIRKAIREQKVEVVFLDSISRAGVGDLTENAPVNRITDLLNGLIPTWFALAHSPRGDDTHVYGSVHFEAAADVMVQLVSQITREKFELGVGLEITKVNDFLPPEMQVVALEFNVDGLGLEGARAASKKEFQELSPSQKGKTNGEVCRDYIEKHGEGCATDIAEATGRNRSNLAEVLSSSPLFVLGRKDGNRSYYWLVPDTNGSVAGNTQGNTGNRRDNRDRHVLPIEKSVARSVAHVLPDPVALIDRARARLDSGLGNRPAYGDGDAGTNINGAVHVLPPDALRAGQHIPSPEEEDWEDVPF